MNNEPELKMDVRQAVQKLDEQQAVARPQPTVADILHAVIERGVSSENVGAVEKIVALYERMQDRDAEKAFAQGFVALQADTPKIKAVRAVPSNDGTIRYKYAPYEEIMDQVRPLLQKHGFTVEFSTEFADGRIVKLCTLQHTGGHKRTNKFAVRIGSGPPRASESQADGAASTYAKRFALCDALNITIDSDSDAAAEGASITKEQADELQRRVAETNSNPVAFLKFCGVTTSNPTFADWEKIPSSRYEAADEMLRRKERGSR